MSEVTPEDQMKLLFPHRPWESEPDHAEWFDAKTGYKCRIQRQTESSGTLCGYVGVFKGHPLHGVGYNDYNLNDDYNLNGLNGHHVHDVHGGLTYSSTDDSGVHWFGFDTAHGGDFCPRLVQMMLKYAPEGDAKTWVLGATGAFKDETYRTWEYVEGEVHKLVGSLWDIETNIRSGHD